MKRTNLTKFISNLEQLINNPYETYKDTIHELIYCVLWQMAKYTITDSAQSRASVIKLFAEKYNKDVSELQEAYHFWESRWDISGGEHRDWDSALTSMSESIDKTSYRVTISSDEEPLLLQENGELKPSRIHSVLTGRDNSQFHVPRHLTYVTDLVNSGKFGGLHQLNYDALVSKLVQDVEKQLFK